MRLSGSSDAKLKVVFDTSVLIAAALRSNFSQILIEQARERIIVSVTSDEILDEFQRSLTKKSDFSPRLIQQYVDELRLISEIVIEPKIKLASPVTRDRSDDKIIECALAAGANLIISLDQDLISLKKYQGIGIVHPKTFGWIVPKDR